MKDEKLAWLDAFVIVIGQTIQTFFIFQATGVDTTILVNLEY